MEDRAIVDAFFDFKLTIANRLESAELLNCETLKSYSLTVPEFQNVLTFNEDAKVIPQNTYKKLRVLLDESEQDIFDKIFLNKDYLKYMEIELEALRLRQLKIIESDTGIENMPGVAKKLIQEIVELFLFELISQKEDISKKKLKKFKNFKVFTNDEGFIIKISEKDE